MVASSQSWSVYMIRSKKTGQIYTGIALNALKRLDLHNAGKGAKATRGKGPWVLIHLEEATGKGPALSREARIKKLSVEQKLALSWL